MGAAAAGFVLGLSLILAIGAQNAFILRQGLRGEHVLALVLVCAVSDAVLIALGVAGFGALVLSLPWVVDVARWGGAIFLIVYGGMSLRAAWRGGQALEAARGAAPGLWRAVATCLMLTWANPHVYLDTVVLLGGLSAQYEPAWMFGAGAVAASFFFFFSLGYGAKLLRPVFASPRAWRMLDAGVGLVMWAIAARLVTQ
ncbi:L-lysine exporter family protein LysE/ArgO [Salinihabitans flavidus]|uniref:L-lysine exporter family protein LysE/ArgO n=1 Tax=Salinihabitans flavidus TaxID=569882 RepID=A0A1H8TW64_9RHOB|nr:LysE/ArgO family amino acid transporter [Salinihabitans flavidus]SEO94834.1 L-lysine exporter family protein LysE/ArgO [Salinihabitans flavidus]